ncbi:MAG: hypothetical protein MJ185_01975 [Treponema sp.]|nr:hypothetical protein [Treponema sp.]
MKKNFLFLIFFVCTFASIYAQVSANPNDSFYKKAAIWEAEGLLENSLPQVRPYPLHIVEEILNQVISQEDDVESEIARTEYERIFGRKWHAGFSVLDTQKNTSNFFDWDFHLSGDAKLFKYGGVSYNLGLCAIMGNETDHYPLFTNIKHEAVQDGHQTGPFIGYADMNCNGWFGNETFFGTAGITRFGFGPFWQEGLALNDSAYHSSGLSYVFRFKPGWQYSQVFTSVGATNNLGQELFSAKYLALHSLKWDINQKFSICYYENSIFGRRMELTYLFPSPYLINQGINGCNDNVQMGLMFEARPVKGLKVSGDFFVDDIAFTGLTLDGKYRVAGTLGASYAPKNSVFRIFDLNYTAVMPYVYAHWDYDDYKDFRMSGTTINYQNYTNSGICMGSSLGPDSDRIKFTGKITPVKNLELDITASFARHQNVCENLPDYEKLMYVFSEQGKYKTDGSLLTHQKIERENGREGYYLDNASDHLNFMTGSHTLKDFVLGIDASYVLKTNKTGTLKFNAGYTFEFIKNYGIDRDIYKGLGKPVVSNEDGTYTWLEKTYESKEALDAAGLIKARAFYDSWASGLTDIVNHFVFAGFTYTW